MPGESSARTRLLESDFPELYRLLVDNLEDIAVFLLDASGEIQSWNPGVERTLGYEGTEFIGRHASIVFTPDDIAARVPEREMATAARNGRAADQRWHVRKDGSALFVDGVLVALRDAPGTLMGYAKVMRDITSRKRAEDGLRFLVGAGAMLASSIEYDATLGNVARLAVPGIADYCIFDLLDGNLLLKRVAWRHRDEQRQRAMDEALGNAPAVNLAGDPIAVELGAGRSVFVPEATPDWIRTALRQTGILELAGEFGLVSAMIVPVRASGATLGALAFCLDGSNPRRYTAQDLRLAEEVGRRAGAALENARLYRESRESARRLEESEQRLRLATEAAGVCAWSMDVESRKLAWSPQCRALFGLPEGADVPDYLGAMNLVHPEDRARVGDAVRRAIEQGAGYDTQFRIVWPDGAVRWVGARGLALRDERGSVTSFAGVALDITARKSAELAAQETHKLESIGVLAGGIAHEFNNLLTGIIGNASLIGEEISRGNAIAERVGDLLDSAERAAELTRQLLAYSGKGRFVLEVLNISEQVRAIGSLLAASVPRHAELRFALAPGLPPVEADRGQIVQAIIDLVINAGEALEGRGGVITVTTAASDLDAGQVRARFPASPPPPGRYVMLEVRDNGTGMDDAIKVRMFDPFFSTKFTGRGLGLAAVQGIMRGHKGAIEVESEPGKGTTMRLFFPSAAEAGESKETGAAEETTARRRLVLVVDDEEIVRSVAKNVLEKHGYAVVTAENGRAAVDLFREIGDRISAVLLDMTMPVMSGEEAMARIREIRPDVPVIASSGYSEAEALRRFGAGISAYLQKPYTAARLARQLSELVPPR